MLELANVVSGYKRGVEVLKRVSIKVQEGEVVAIIGPNGAGKTTLLRTVSGQMHPGEGTIKFRGENVHHLAPEKIVRLGISQVPEGGRVFADQSVKDNLLLGAYAQHFGKERRMITKNLKLVLEWFPNLSPRLNQLAGTLSGGERMMLAIARALMAGPSLLLLDEPSLGLSPLMRGVILQLIKHLNAHKIAIMLVEQMVPDALSVADNVYVIEHGRVVLEGDSQAVAAHPRVKTAYLDS